MYERFTDGARKVMQLANQEAQRFNHEYIGTEHILLGLVQDNSRGAAHVLKNLKVNLLRVRQEVEKIVQSGPAFVAQGKLPHTPRAKKVLEYSIEEARNLNHNYVGTEHLLLGLLREHEGIAVQVLMNLGVSLEAARKEILSLLGHDSGESESGSPQTARKGKTPSLDSFGTDLTLMAKTDKLGPIVGRDEEITHIQEILSGWTVKHPVLIGEPGVGKRSVVHGLVQRMTDRRLIDLNLTALLLKAKHIDLLWEAVRPCLNEARKRADVILFLPNWMSLIGVDGPEEAVGGLFAVLPVCGVRCILTGTPTEWERGLSRFPFLKGALEPVLIHPPTLEETLAIGLAQRDRYAAHHQVTITDAAVRAAVELSDRYLTFPSQPAKTLGVLDRAGACVRLKTVPRQPDTQNLDDQLEQLAREIDAMIAQQDFDRAAHLRQLANKLSQDKVKMGQEWRERPRGVVNEESIIEVVSTMAKQTGLTPV